MGIAQQNYIIFWYDFDYKNQSGTATCIVYNLCSVHRGDIMCTSTSGSVQYIGGIS